MATSPVTLTGKTVMLIDSSDADLAKLRAFFEEKGNVVLSVSSGATALELFRVKDVDAVVMDYSFPDMTAERIATEIKKLKPRLPIVLYATDLPSVPPNALGLVDTFLGKNQPPEQLVPLLERAFRRAARLG
jgi:CheY-like chemotaxis protein